MSISYVEWDEAFQAGYCGDRPLSDFPDELIEAWQEGFLAKVEQRVSDRQIARKFLIIAWLQLPQMYHHQLPHELDRLNQWLDRKETNRAMGRGAAFN